MRCKACGTENESYMEFCVKCAEELPRESREAAAPPPVGAVPPGGVQNIAFDEFDPQPYDYRLPYRPSRSYPEGYERPKAPESAPRRQSEADQFQQRPSPAYEPPVRPVPRMSAQMPPIPEPRERTMDVPIVRIAEPYSPQHHAQPVQQPVAPQVQPSIPQPIPQPVQQSVQQPVQQPVPQSVQQPVPQPVPPHQQRAADELPEDMPAPVHSPDEPLMEPSEDRKRRKKRPEPPRPPKKPRRKSDYDDDYEDDDDYDEQPKRGGALMVVLYISIAVLLLAAVWFAGSYINEEYGSVAKFVESVFGTSAPADPDASPTDNISIEVKPGMREGQPVHEIAFYGESGQTIELPSIGVQKLSRTFDFTASANYIPIIAPDNLFIPEEPGADTPEEITVKLEANLIDADKQVYPLDVPEFTVQVPQATLTLSQPSALAVTLEAPTLTLAGKVSTGARLFIDGSDASGILDELGNFSYDIEIPEYGDRTIVLEAKALYQRSQTAEIQVSYPKREVPLTVEGAVPSASDPYVGVLEGTQDDTIEIRGTFESGAWITIEGAVEGDPTVDSEEGTYSFVGLLENYGLNTFNIRAEKDGAESSFALSVEKKPDVEEYTPKARSMDYESLSEHADDQIDRIYLCEGTVSEFIQDAPYPIFLFNVGDEEEPQNILMEYYGTTALDTAKNYRIYGDVAGMDTERGLPKIMARFIYER